MRSFVRNEVVKYLFTRLVAASSTSMCEARSANRYKRFSSSLAGPMLLFEVLLLHTERLRSLGVVEVGSRSFVVVRASRESRRHCRSGRYLLPAMFLHSCSDRQTGHAVFSFHRQGSAITGIGLFVFRYRCESIHASTGLIAASRKLFFAGMPPTGR